MSNDELQRAIDDITQSGGAGMAAPTTPVMGENNENEQLVSEFGGDTSEAADVAPIMPATPAPAEEEPNVPEIPSEALETPPMAPQGDMEAPMAAIPEVEEAPKFEMPEVEKVEEVAPESEMTEKVEENAPNMMNDGGDLEEVKKNALKELYPLLKNMNINPEQAFDICKDVAEMGEKGAIKEAFEAAKKITDENKKADALLEIVQMIDK